MAKVDMINALAALRQTSTKPTTPEDFRYVNAYRRTGRFRDIDGLMELTPEEMEAESADYNDVVEDRRRFLERLRDYLGTPGKSVADKVLYHRLRHGTGHPVAETGLLDLTDYPGGRSLDGEDEEDHWLTGGFTRPIPRTPLNKLLNKGTPKAWPKGGR